jgi:hypothetical protein
MATMTDEEADVPAELLTRTTQKIRAGEGGVMQFALFYYF